MYGQPPPGNWGPPQGYPQQQQQPYPYPYPQQQPPPQQPKRSWLTPRLILYAIVLGIGAVGVIVMVIVAMVQAGRNYVVFDSDGKDHHAKIDGKDVGSTKSASAIQVQPGKHKLELVDAKGQVLAETTTQVPESGWRGVFSSVPNTRYAVVTVTYDSVTKPTVKMLKKAGPSLHAMEDGNLLTMEMESLGQPFPTSAKKNTSATRLCRVDTSGEPECLR